jgi:hypothetical protein
MLCIFGLVLLGYQKGPRLLPFLEKFVCEEHLETERLNWLFICCLINFPLALTFKLNIAATTKHYVFLNRPPET